MSDKLNELIANVKELIQDGSKSTEHCIKDIDNEIDIKENEIRELFADNIQSVIAHFLTHHETLFYHKRLELDCEEFSKHIEKAQKLNAYDEQQIERSEKNLEFMKSIRNKLADFRVSKGIPRGTSSWPRRWP
jgi:predicted SprT family Zn-dependent metalloprotease